MSTTKIIYGLYADDDDLMHGVKAFNDKGIKINEVYTPFPVHGLDKALGLRKTRISDAAFIYACYGLTIGALVTWYTMNHDWPQNIGGKPAFDWAHNMPAFVVPMFELMVFCAAHMMSLTFFVRNKMYPMAPAQNPDPRTTDDKFMMEFLSDDVEKIKQLLIETGAEEITVKDANLVAETKPEVLTNETPVVVADEKPVVVVEEKPAIVVEEPKNEQH